MVAAKRMVTSALLLSALSAQADETAEQALLQAIREQTAAITADLISWRRDIHQHPELGGQEKRTSALVASHLQELGLEVRTGLGGTGVVGLLRGKPNGPVVALRADMDALPVQEPATLPFASKATGNYFGEQVPLMHACGHDAHTAMLMAAAAVLAGQRDQLPGTVMFIFQPAEEGSSLVRPGEGKSWGALRMLEDGLFEELKPEAVFALHVMPGEAGRISWREGPVTASSDTLSVTVRGKQGHGGMPWDTVDPIVTSGLVLAGMQTVVSRRAALTESPAVVTVGSIHGGTGPNVIPDQVRMTGTIRTYTEAVRERVKADIALSAKKIAESTGATADVSIVSGYPTTVNDAELVRLMAPLVERVADGRIGEAPMLGASEDFSYFAQEVPGFYLSLGVTPPGQDPATAAPNHNPNFFVHEPALEVGARVLASLAAGYLAKQTPPSDAASSR